mmetsp:Transcript_2569/g.5396  ORF Transcript_2569/g.5396 Transcript_2569/m.5396 type:complete len:173 (+) Transcript_2569:270-788(+)
MKPPNYLLAVAAVASSIVEAVGFVEPPRAALSKGTIDGHSQFRALRPALRARPDAECPAGSVRYAGVGAPSSDDRRDAIDGVLLSELNDLEVARAVMGSGGWIGAEDAALLKSAPHYKAGSATFWSALTASTPPLAGRSPEECEARMVVLTVADAGDAPYRGSWKFSTISRN